jgi:hypothetical protein
LRTGHSVRLRGALAQLVARFHGMEEVRGSSPLSSTIEPLVRPPFVIVVEALWLVGLTSAYQSAYQRALTNVPPSSTDRHLRAVHSTLLKPPLAVDTTHVENRQVDRLGEIREGKSSSASRSCESVDIPGSSGLDTSVPPGWRLPLPATLCTRAAHATRRPSTLLHALTVAQRPVLFDRRAASMTSSVWRPSVIVGRLG